MTPEIDAEDFHTISDLLRHNDFGPDRAINCGFPPVGAFEDTANTSMLPGIERGLLNAIMKSLGDAVITTDVKGIVEYMNPVAEKLSGITLSAGLGRPIETVFEILDEHLRQPIQNPVVTCLESGTPIELSHHLLVCRGERECVVEGSVAPVRDHNDRLLGTVTVFHDVTKARHVARQLSYRATHDSLTGLVNRYEFGQRLNQVLASTCQRGTQHALCYLDLDSFKNINDTAGHHAGDEMLRLLTAQLVGQLRIRDTLARIGGDEFGLLLENCPKNNAIEIAESLVQTVRNFRFRWENQQFQVGISIGLVAIRSRMRDVDQLLKQADLACYIAKNQGGNRLYVYPTQTDRLLRHVAVSGKSAELEQALTRNSLLLHGQPVFPLSRAGGGRPAFQEILLRMRDHPAAVLPLSRFMANAQRCGLMTTIDRWVITKVLREHQKLFVELPEQGIAIKLSDSAIKDNNLVEFIARQLSASMMSPPQIRFDITAMQAIANLTQAIRFMTDLREIGCRLALTQLGSGPVPFNHLRQLPADYLKIAGEVVEDIVENPINQAIVEAVHKTGRLLGAETIAANVESQAILEKLRPLGIDYVQGYALGTPQPLERCDKDMAITA